MRTPSDAASFAAAMLRISGDRTWKHPLTHQQRLFAVWHRLPSDSPASPVVSGLSWLSSSRPSHFSTVPGLVSPVSPVARLKAPHAGQVARSCFSNNSRAPWMGLRSRSCFTHFGRWRPCSIDNEQGISASPSLGQETGDGEWSTDWNFYRRDRKFTVIVHPHMSQPEISRRPNRIECRDYSESIGFCHTRPACRSAFRITPNKPPSIWTSQSPGIQLYGPIA